MTQYKERESPDLEEVGMVEGSNIQWTLTQENGVHVPCETQSGF